jgi:hypothetical protein
MVTRSRVSRVTQAVRRKMIMRSSTWLKGIINTVISRERLREVTLRLSIWTAVRLIAS